MNKAQQVQSLMNTCLRNAGSDERTILVDGIVNNFAFSAERISENEKSIVALLNEMPMEFHSLATDGGGGGWSFLNLCIDKDGDQWGEHPDMEALISLGIAIKKARYQMPKDIWPSLPGGMPYVVFDTT